MTDAAIAKRTMTLNRVINAAVDLVWAAWSNPETLPLWWGPDGYSCRTTRIDLREGGEWVFDMIGPDGTIYPNHHRITRMEMGTRIDYTLHWGENGPKHAHATVRFRDIGGKTEITMAMTFLTQVEHDQALGYHATELGLQTLGKLARFIGAD